MIKFEGKIDDTRVGYFNKRRRDAPSRCYSDTIYSFDIETTSLFNIGGKWDVFNYDLGADEYSHEEHMMLAVPYIWMFGVEDKVYYGRNFMDFEKVLLQISDKSLTKICIIHNLSFEMQFLQNIFDKYTISEMCARDVRKPISFYVEELNIEFRCSYMLTNLSLEKASEEYTDVQKKHSLEYDSKVRTELTTLTPLELEYCEYDIICLYKIMCHFRDQWKHLARVPLTATGLVRKALQKKVSFSYIKHMWDLVPPREMYIKMMATFQGGYTHANALNSGRVFTTDKSDTKEGHKIVDSIKSFDLSSSYPTVMCLEKFPSTKFRKIDYDDYLDYCKSNNWCFIMRLGFHDVKSKYYNNYISYSKAIEVSENNLVYDNGRIRSSAYIEMYVTNIDLDIIRHNYDISKIDFLEIYVSEARYLDIKVIQFILELYNNKTKLKGVSEKESIYKLSKAYINSLY